MSLPDLGHPLFSSKTVFKFRIHEKTQQPYSMHTIHHENKTGLQGD